MKKEKKQKKTNKGWAETGKAVGLQCKGIYRTWRTLNQQDTGSVCEILACNMLNDSRIMNQPCLQ